MSPQDQIHALHEMQARHHAEVPLSEDYGARASAWLDDRTTDYWRHDRMRRCLQPLLVEPQRWLTVGDGRFGADANWLRRQGQDVLCTDIQDRTLAIAAEAGAIGEFAAANAERLAYPDGSFDWALCKESYHHMPRAPMAFYELLRVTRKGVVLIEPVDSEADRWWGHLSLPLLNMVKARKHAYEDSGNYVFSLSRREIEKLMLGIGLTRYAALDLSDCFMPGGEHEIGDGPLRRRMARNIRLRDWVKRVLGVTAQMAVFVVVHQGTSVPDALRQAPWRFHELPRNPFAGVESP